jgi:hypothetical protein
MKGEHENYGENYPFSFLQNKMAFNLRTPNLHKIIENQTHFDNIHQLLIFYKTFQFLNFSVLSIKTIIIINQNMLENETSN